MTQEATKREYILDTCYIEGRRLWEVFYKSGDKKTWIASFNDVIDANEFFDMKQKRHVKFETTVSEVTKRYGEVLSMISANPCDEQCPPNCNDI